MTLVVAETGEKVDNAVELAVPEPNSLVAVNDQCQMIEAWAETVDSVPLLQDAANKLAAIDEYLNRTSTEGRGRVAAAMRRLEVRIGQLLPRQQGRRTDKELPNRGQEVPLNDKQKADFRAMAENEDVVEEAIAESTDEKPASRKKVKAAIKRQANPIPKAKDRRPSLPDSAMRAGVELRKAIERLERIASDDRFAANREQVAVHWNGHLSYAIEVCQDLVNELNEEKS